MQETIVINLIIYNMIFIPIIIALSGFIYFLVFYVCESAWVVAFVNIFLNMFLFHWLYVMRLHNDVDRIWTYQKKRWYEFFDRLFASIRIFWLFFDMFFSSFVRFVESDMRKMIKWSSNEGGRIYVNKSYYYGCGWDTF